MATVTPMKVSVNIRLNNGTDEQGNVKTVTLNLGRLSIANFNADKVLALKNLLQPCLAKTVYAVEKVEVSSITPAV